MSAEWQAVLSPLAWRIYTEVRDATEDSTVRIEEWAREFRASKTAIRAALGELEQRGFVVAYLEED